MVASPPLSLNLNDIYLFISSILAITFAKNNANKYDRKISESKSANVDYMNIFNNSVIKERLDKSELTIYGSWSNTI